MSKLTAALAAFPIAMIFMTVFLKTFKTSWKKLIGQFTAFLAVCFPLGMWFPLRGLIRWGIPLTYVQELEEMNQSIKGITFWERITDFSPRQLESVFINWLSYDSQHNPVDFNEHNPLIAIMKNSIFSEFIRKSSFEDNMFMTVICYILFWIGVILAASAFTAMIIYLFRKCKANTVQKLFLVFFHIILIVNLYILSKNYPMVCSMNFRYIMPTVITGSLFLGFFLYNNEKTENRAVIILKKSLCITSVIFAAMSALVYLAAAVIPDYSK